MKFNSIVILLGIILFSQNVKSMEQEKEERRKVIVRLRHLSKLTASSVNTNSWHTSDSSVSPLDKAHISLQIDERCVSVWPGIEGPNHKVSLCLEHRASAPYVLLVDSKEEEEFARTQGLDSCSEQEVFLYANKINAFMDYLMRGAVDFTNLTTNVVLGKVLDDVRWDDISMGFSEFAFTDAKLIRHFLYMGGIDTRYQECTSEYLRNIVEKHKLLENEISLYSIEKLKQHTVARPKGIYELCERENEVSHKFQCLEKLALLIGDPQFLYLKPSHLKEIYKILFKTSKGFSYENEYESYMKKLKATYEDTSLVGSLSAWWNRVTGKWESKDEDYLKGGSSKLLSFRE